MHSMLELPEYMKRAVFIGGSIVGVFLLIGVGIWGIASCSSPPVSTAQKVTATPTAKASPLLFGTNLNLLNNTEARAATAPSKQALFESLHLHIIRLAIPPKASTQAVTRTAQYIRSVGATPLVNLQGRLDNDALANDLQVVKVMNQVFGQATVYYEYGNEDDAQGVSAENYTTSWNTIVPRLKQVARQGQFVGPVTYHYDQRYLQTFLLRANPQPNEVSWHEYTCDNAESKQ